MQQQAVGVSPDGLGYVPQQSISPYQYTGGEPPVLQPGAPMPVQYPLQGYQAPFIEPKDTSPQAAVQSVGVSALLASVGIAGGAALGGGWGAGAGLLLSAAVMNGYRAQKWMSSAVPGERHEAVVSSTFGLFQAAGGAYLIYRAMKSKK